MKKMIGIALLVMGIILLLYGLNASESIESAFSRVFTGSPSRKTMWLITGGAISSVVGLFCIFSRGR